MNEQNHNLFGIWCQRKHAKLEIEQQLPEDIDDK
jgi:hypothetical protein